MYTAVVDEYDAVVDGENPFQGVVAGVWDGWLSVFLRHWVTCSVERTIGDAYLSIPTSLFTVVLQCSMPLVYTTYNLRAYVPRLGHKRLDHVLNMTRTLYNAALQERRDAWKHAGVTVKLYDQHKEFTGVRADDPEWQGLDVHIGRGALNRLDGAFQAFFRRVKDGGTPGFPRFKTESRWRTLDITRVGPRMIKPLGDGRWYLTIKGLPKLTVWATRELPPPERLRAIRVTKRNRRVSVSLGV